MDSMYRSPKRWDGGHFSPQRTRVGCCGPMASVFERVLDDAQSMDELGPRFAGDLTAAEVRYMVENEWAQNADDVLWRRSKIGLKATAEEYAALDRFIASLCGERGGSTA